MADTKKEMMAKIQSSCAQVNENPKGEDKRYVDHSTCVNKVKSCVDAKDFKKCLNERLDQLKESKI